VLRSHDLSADSSRYRPGIRKLTIGAGALAAVAIFPELSIAEALLLAIALGPTDAALGQAVVTNPEVPDRIRDGLNVESGLNDGIATPLLLIVIAVAEAQAHKLSGSDALRILAEQIGYGLLVGAGTGVLLAIAISEADRRKLIAGAWLPIATVAGAALAYGAATQLGGSGFIAAFVAGTTFGHSYTAIPSP
jgi:NhaP-type Na+/H+ or K+/H+ antiporter